MASSSSHCTDCGAPLARGVPGLRCPACLGADLFGEVAGSGEPALTIGGYALLEELGRGGMGVVYRAQHERLGRAAAVKLILSGALASGQERQRFLGEMAAAAALDHPHIVPVYEAGEDSGQLWYAMRLVPGSSLAARMRTQHGTAMPAREAATLVHTLALAVQHAHERGFIHRDLKPANILLDETGAPHIADFGLARRVDSAEHLTLTGAALGTPAYMAPEQAGGGRQVTTAADVYSLGAILYELLSGHAPFRGESLTDVLLAIRERDPAALSATDRDLDIICRKCLAKEPARRYPSALALAEDLQRWLSGDPISARPAGSVERFTRWCRRRPAIAGLVAAVVLLFLSGLSGVLWQWTRANREARTAREALEKSEESLWKANASEARARRGSRERGQRLESLRSLNAAAAHRPTMALRNEAIAAMAYPDISEPQLVVELPAGTRDCRAGTGMTRLASLTASTLHLQNIHGQSEAVLSLPALDRFTVDAALERILLMAKRAEAGSAAELWRLRDGTAEKVQAWDQVHSGALSPDGSLLLLHRAGRLEIIETADGTPLRSAELPGVSTMTEISPDGTLAAVLTPDGSNGATAGIWSLDPLRQVRTTPQLPAGVHQMRWHPQDGSLFVCAAETAFRLRPAAETLERVTSHGREGVLVEVHPQDHYLLSTAWDGVVKISAPGPEGELLRTTGFRPVNFSADGTQLAVRVGNRAGICRLAPLRAWKFLTTPVEGPAPWSHVAFSPDSRLLAAIRRDLVTFIDPETLARRATVKLKSGINGEWLPDGSFLLSDEREGILKIDLKEKDGMLAASPARFLRSNAADTKFGWLHTPPDGRCVAITSGGAVAVHDLQNRRTLSIIQEQPMLGRAVLSPDGKWVATGYWNNQLSGGAEAHVFTPEGQLVKKLPSGSCVPAFTPDSRRLILGSTHEYVEWDTATWSEVRRHPREASGLDSGLAGFSATAGLMVVQASETVLRLLRLDSSEELAAIDQPAPQKINQLALSPDGRWLAVQMGTSLRLWDIAAMREELRGLGLDWE